MGVGVTVVDGCESTGSEVGVVVGVVVVHDGGFAGGATEVVGVPGSLPRVNDETESGVADVGPLGSELRSVGAAPLVRRGDTGA